MTVRPALEIAGSPLSAAERHLFRLGADSRAYRSVAAIDLAGPCDPAALRAALLVAAGRHATLSSPLRRLPGMRFPLRVAEKALSPAWSEEDLTALPETARQEALARLFTAAADRPFDLARGPLVHAVLARLGPGSALLLLAVPALAADRLSLRQLTGEIAALYGGGCLPAPFPYQRYADWQRELAATPAGRTAGDLWRERQATAAPPALRLPLEQSDPFPGFAPAGVAGSWDGERLERIAALAARLAAARAAVVLAAWQALLLRLTGEGGCVAATIDGRGQPQLGEALGPYARTVPLPPPPGGDPTFARTVEEADAALAESADWCDGFDPGDAAAVSPGVVATFESVPKLANFQGGGVTFTLVREAAWGERCKAGFLVRDEGGRMDVELVYDTRLLAAEDARSLLERLGRLLDDFLAEPSRRLSEPEITSAEEREQIARTNRTARVLADAETPLHHLIERQVDATPEAPAVVFGTHRLSYREIDQRANRLAHRLRELGAGPEARVGICLERSADLVVSLLAVLKAGAAYVPLDPTYPAERLAWMAEDAAVAVVVARGPHSLGPTLPGQERRKENLLALDAEEERLAAFPSTRPEPLAGPGHLAYVIYTSGSTGKPKGAMNSHRGIVNRLLWMRETYDLGPGDRVLQKTPMSFDVSVWEFFWPLLTGACLVVAKPGGHQDPAYLAEIVAEQGITNLHFVPSMFGPFLDTHGAARCTGVRRVFASGEALTPELAARAFAVLPWIELHNLYGPTEAAVEVTSWACRPGEEAVPIGLPVANTAIHVLDREMRPVPPGVLGEVWIGGVQVARGYLGRPELTAERFLPDPFSTLAGARLYRTGDLGSRRRDGAVLYAGRTDFQVKVRGLRIELGEIEAALAAHPDVREAAVLAREDRPGDKRLVAYLVAGRERTPAVEELRRHLAGTLPEFMVPAAFVFLPALPLSPNGKLDRKALPAPGAARPDLASEYVAPRDATETVLAEVWAEVLGVERVGIHDSFFALGGDSILSVRAAALAAERGLAVTVEHLFRRQTIAQLAEDLAGAAAESPGGEDEELARLLAELDTLSDEEVRAQLAERATAGEEAP